MSGVPRAWRKLRASTAADVENVVVRPHGREVEQQLDVVGLRAEEGGDLDGLADGRPLRDPHLHEVRSVRIAWDLLRAEQNVRMPRHGTLD